MKKYIWVGFILIAFNASAESVDVESSDNSISINNGHISVHSSGGFVDGVDYEDSDDDDYNGDVVVDDGGISIGSDNIDVDIE